MNKIIRSKLYFVIVISLFILYVYSQNIQVKNEFESNFDCSIVPGSIETCISDKNTTLTAVISSKPYQNGSFLVYRTNDLALYFDIDEDILVGDRLEVVGKLEKRLIKPGYIEKRLMSSDISLLSRGKYKSLWSFQKWLYSLSQLSKYLRSIIDDSLTPTHSKLVAGILFGSRENIPITLYNNLINSGTIHIIAASGYNISIIAGFVISIFSKMFNKSYSLILAIIAILIFVVISGGGEAVVRAAIMGVIAFGSQYFGRMYTSLYSLGLTIVIMLLFQQTLINSVSFQLSVSSTLGILIIGDKLSRLNILKQKGESLHILINTFRLDFITTLSATLATLPVILFHFSRVSLVTLVVNMLVLWVVPPIMLFGFVLTVLGAFSIKAAIIFSYLLWPFLTYFTQVVSLFGELSFASLEAGWLNGYLVVGYYALLYSWSSIKHKNMPIYE